MTRIGGKEDNADASHAQEGGEKAMGDCEGIVADGGGRESEKIIIGGRGI
jgi:hypothetical protein